MGRAIPDNVIEVTERESSNSHKWLAPPQIHTTSGSNSGGSGTHTTVLTRRYSLKSSPRGGSSVRVPAAPDPHIEMIYTTSGSAPPRSPSGRDTLPELTQSSHGTGSVAVRSPITPSSPPRTYAPRSYSLEHRSHDAVTATGTAFADTSLHDYRKSHELESELSMIKTSYAQQPAPLYPAGDVILDVSDPYTTSRYYPRRSSEDRKIPSSTRHDTRQPRTPTHQRARAGAFVAREGHHPEGRARVFTETRHHQANGDFRNREVSSPFSTSSSEISYLDQYEQEVGYAPRPPYTHSSDSRREPRTVPRRKSWKHERNSLAVVRESSPRGRREVRDDYDRDESAYMEVARSRTPRHRSHHRNKRRDPSRPADRDDHEREGRTRSRSHGPNRSRTETRSVSTNRLINLSDTYLSEDVTYLKEEVRPPREAVRPPREESRRSATTSGSAMVTALGVAGAVGGIIYLSNNSKGKRSDDATRTDRNPHSRHPERKHGERKHGDKRTSGSKRDHIPEPSGQSVRSRTVLEPKWSDSVTEDTRRIRSNIDEDRGQHSHRHHSGLPRSDVNISQRRRGPVTDENRPQPGGRGEEVRLPTDRQEDREHRWQRDESRRKRLEDERDRMKHERSQTASYEPTRTTKRGSRREDRPHRAYRRDALDSESETDLDKRIKTAENNAKGPNMILSNPDTHSESGTSHRSYRRTSKHRSRSRSNTGSDHSSRSRERRASSEAYATDSQADGRPKHKSLVRTKPPSVKIEDAIDEYAIKSPVSEASTLANEHCPILYPAAEADAVEREAANRAKKLAETAQNANRSTSETATDKSSPKDEKGRPGA